jgi:hypothetical protein
MNFVISNIDTFRNPNASIAEMINYLSQLRINERLTSRLGEYAEARRELQKLKNREQYLL